MKHTFLPLLFALPLLAGCSGSNTLTSPDGKVKVDFTVNADGVPVYSVAYDGEDIVLPSEMSFAFVDGPSFDGFHVTGVSRTQADTTWTTVWGENLEIRDNYRQMTISLENKQGFKTDVVFRAYDDGAAFRYVFPQQSGIDSLVIKTEDTQMAMGGDYTAWWIPGDYDTQEYEYTKSKLSEIRAHGTGDHMENLSQSIFSPVGVQTSLLLKTPSGKYVNLHEAQLIDYPAMHLVLNDTTMTFTSHLTPSPDGNAAVVELPFRTPWRVVMLGEKATDILASNLIYNLNDPNVIEDTSWIKPVKFMGVWWEMITGAKAWSYTDAEDFDLATFDYSKAKPHGRHAANNERVKEYIDFAADAGMDQLLVEGWNVGWEDWFGKEKEYVFDFVTPYPDFDLKGLNEYARSKGIKLMMHHESSGAIDNYTAHLDTAYTLMNELGYDAVKSGYVGNILPIGHNHYDQRAVRHYLMAVQKAAEHHIMVDAHEAVRPTGLARTYPNLLANESAMGQEFQNMSPEHVTVLPFTRLKGGPMDFTPGIFEMDLSTFAPGNNTHKRATVANQLALYLTMYSPLQMAADLPEHYAAKADAFQFIKDVPVDWSESRYIDAEPSEYIVVARRDRNSDNWFAGGVAASQGHSGTLDLDFLEPGATYTATIYADAPDADCDSNPAAYVIEKRTLTANDTYDYRMAPGGGFAISFFKD